MRAMGFSIYQRGLLPLGDKALLPLIIVVVLFLSGCGVEPPEGGDDKVVDRDHDGLIEIDSLEDLDEVRNNLDGKALFGSSKGCPESGCKGFELEADLNFDADGDGVITAADPYWNEGLGWLPLGQGEDSADADDEKFTAVFEGNGHSIKHLTISRSSRFHLGLFVQLDGAEIRNLGLSDIQINGFYGVAGLAGFVQNSTIKGCYATGALEGLYMVGGLAGDMRESKVIASYAHITSREEHPLFAATGIAGYLLNSTIEGSYAVVKGVPVGTSNFSIETNSGLQDSIALFIYVDVETGSITNFDPQMLTNMQCPTQFNDAACPEAAIYASWPAYKNQDGQPYWQFGTNRQLPYLHYQTADQLDSDGDGIKDSQDAFPAEYLAQRDRDGDGAPGVDEWDSYCDDHCKQSSSLTVDQFPDQAAAVEDRDLDGLPEQWAPNCNDSCQQLSDLTLDPYPDDRDNDGIADHEDIDDNGDGVEDADRDGDGLLDILTLAQLNLIRNDPHGYAFNDGGTQDSSGCPIELVGGAWKQRCRGYELLADLDFDANGDGLLDENDPYWNQGQGWESIDIFSSILEGNGHLILNFMANRPSQTVGLFRTLENAEIRNVGFTGPLMSVLGDNEDIVGARGTGRLDSVFVAGGSTLALLTGSNRVELHNCFVTGAHIKDAAASSPRYFRIRQNNLYNVFVAYHDGGIVSRQPREQTQIWTQLHDDELAMVQQAPRSALACAESSASCSETLDLSSWQQKVNGGVDQPWRFGDANQLPGLAMGSTVYRDSDGDGVLDRFDAFPLVHGASIDADNDGAPERWHDACGDACLQGSGLLTDRFPENPALAGDSDLDGLPDGWAPGCDKACQQQYTMAFDPYVDDHDNDGLPDQLDTDDNNDGIDDADADSNGLIDIASWGQLDAIRYSLAGEGRRLEPLGSLDSSGCPAHLVNGKLAPVCRGYELVKDLDFDTNGDGKFSDADQFWRDGYGWRAIGDGPGGQAFSAEFNGNGYALKNLVSLRDNTSDESEDGDSNGLFGFIEGATIRNTVILGPLSRITGGLNTGALVGSAFNSVVTQCYASAEVTYTGKAPSSAFPEYRSVGGLVGIARDSLIYANAVSADVTGSTPAGLVGAIIRSTVRANSVTGRVFAPLSLAGSYGYPAGLVAFGQASEVIHNYSAARLDGPNHRYYPSVGLSPSNVESGSFFTELSIAVDESYWAEDLINGPAVGKGSPVTLAELKCATHANDQSCGSTPLFAGWDEDVDEFGNPIWQFGTSEQLPILRFQLAITLDSDGDKVPDDLDAFPNIWTASVDQDGDGAADSWNPEWLAQCKLDCAQGAGVIFDQFPTDPAFATDADMDGYPDTWAPNCDAECRLQANMSLDPFLNDSDNDGVPNDQDVDDDGDGTPDVDSDSDGLIDIHNWDELDAIRNELSGASLRVQAGAVGDHSGCPYVNVGSELQSRCWGYELMADLSFSDAVDTHAAVVADVEGAPQPPLPGGWQPIGRSEQNAFTAIFEGNGHVIRNLQTNEESDYQGLFGFTRDADIRHLGIEGNWLWIRGNQYVGALVGQAHRTHIRDCYVHGDVAANFSAGGLVGVGIELVVERSYFLGSYAGPYSGGILGTEERDEKNRLSSVINSYVSAPRGPLNLSSTLGGGNTRANNYVAYIDDIDSFGVSQAVLACPTHPNEGGCDLSQKILFKDWVAFDDPLQTGYWDFGSDTDVPRLRPR